MKIIYMSNTGNLDVFVNHLNVSATDIIKIDDTKQVPFINGEQYIIIAPTYEADLTSCLNDFIEYNGPQNAIGVIGSGNINFGEGMYLFTAHDIEHDYNIPFLHGFEYAGMQPDYDKVNAIIKKHNTLED